MFYYLLVNVSIAKEYMSCVVVWIIATLGVKIKL